MTAFIDAISGYASNAVRAIVWLFSGSGSFLSPLPLLAALVIAAAVVAWRMHKSGAQLSIGGVAKELFPPAIYKHPSARQDLWIILINDGLLFFLPLIAAVSVGILGSLVADATGAHEALARQPGAGLFQFVLFGIYYTLVWDFFATYAHYLKHKIPVLWEFHKVHHCAEVLTPLTAMRRHPVEIIISAIITGCGIALAVILWVLVFGAPGTTLEIGGLTLGVYLWRLLGYNIRHTHVWISYGPFWNNILMSPAHHQLHHSRDPRHHDCNFGHIFSWWDRLFGTLYQPRSDETFEFGIELEENEKLRTLGALYIRPMQRAAARYTPKRRAGGPVPAAE